MEPEQKENMVLSYITYSFLGLFMLVVAFIIFNETRQNKKVVKYDQEFRIPEVTLLTPEEVEAERRILIERSPKAIFSVTDIETSIEYQTDLPIAKVVTQEEIKKEREKLVAGTSETGIRVYDPKTAQTQPFQQVVSKSHDSNVTFLDQKDKIVKNIEGMIYSVDYDNNRIVVTQSDGSGFGIIHITDETKITINNKKISINNLKVADSVVAEGEGYAGMSEVLAEVLIVTGSLRLF